MTIVYNDSNYDLISEINNIKEYFNKKNIIMGIVESVEDGIRFVKIFCDDKDCTKRTMSVFNLYLASAIYKVVIDEFNRKYMENFLNDTYFFLKSEEIYEIKELSKEVLLGEGAIVDEKDVYCINIKNSIVEKIIDCMEENREINIKGFLTFRMKEICDDLQSIIDKVIERYMVEKEYNEFIKLLKYFVEIQDSKMEEVNIIIENNGEYIIKNKDGVDILDELINDLVESKYNETVSMEDVIISGLITNAPQKIIIHCVENCKNNEFIDTIKKVFLDRAVICNNCKFCSEIHANLKN